jgi:hypothetical protein
MTRTQHVKAHSRAQRRNTSSTPAGVAEWTLKCCRPPWRRDRQQGTAGMAIPPCRLPYTRQPRITFHRPPPCCSYSTPYLQQRQICDTCSSGLPAQSINKALVSTHLISNNLFSVGVLPEHHGSYHPGRRTDLPGGPPIQHVDIAPNCAIPSRQFSVCFGKDVQSLASDHPPIPRGLPVSRPVPRQVCDMSNRRAS